MQEIFSQVSSRPGALIVEVYWYQSHQYLFFNFYFIVTAADSLEPAHAE